MDISQILGWTATILFSLMLIPQIIKTIKLKDTKGVSVMLFVTYLLANIVALIYAFMIIQTPLKIKYTIGILTGIFYISIFVYYSGRKNQNEKNI